MATLPPAKQGNQWVRALVLAGALLDHPPSTSTGGLEVGRAWGTNRIKSQAARWIRRKRKMVGEGRKGGKNDRTSS
jgi:hypothetical protein